ncbi:chromate transporter [Peptoniphilus duerdenii]|uniref:chromate transporter n=1 Tax=Peptoniphilus duerdenii TaxID=507750 RepID=UPI00288B3939|nr:chromate transporter [Peptoniphilus duerdenii]
MKKISLIKLFLTFFKINALTFGGGYTIVPIVKDVFVEELEAISEDDMLDIVALAQGGPGAMAISTSILTGYKVCGPVGAVVALVASTLPCLITLSLVAKFYTEFKENFFISSALLGISGIISAVLFITVLRMGKTAYKKHPLFSSVVMAIIFLLGMFANMDTVYLIIFSALSGIIVFGIGGRK